MFALMPWTRRSALLRRVELPDEFGTLINRVLNDWPEMETIDWPNRWGLTTEENDKEFVLRFELPGFETPEVKVEIAGDRVLVEAEHKTPEAKTEERSNERSYAHVKRSITLPTGTNLDKIEAIYRNGVLEVHVPRVPEAMGRKIEVKT